VRSLGTEAFRPRTGSSNPVPSSGESANHRFRHGGRVLLQRTGSFDPTAYRDRYQEALRELIEAKMKGLTAGPIPKERGPLSGRCCSPTTTQMAG
jgi:non-homologous end joining protein Ku